MCRTNYRYHRIVFAVLTSLAIGACAPGSSITRVFADPAYEDASYDKILVIAGIPSYENRSLLERSMANALTESGIEASAMYQVGGGNRPIDRDAVLEVVRAGEYDAVLFTRTVSTDANFTNKTAQTTVDPNRVSGRPINLFRYDYEEHPEPDYVSLAAAVTLSTELYDVASEGKIWEAQTDLAAQEVVSYLVDDAVALVSGALKKDRLLANQ